ncbi:unnamed protein product, partial [Mesorhabditis spiculigera]
MQPFLLLPIFAAVAGARGFFGIPGQYCATRTPTCCQNRNDDCTVPILGDHLCYCDVFCDRGPNGGNDCCPDFEAVCRADDRPAQNDINGKECQYNGRWYDSGDEVTKNCETCRCVDSTWSCQRAACLIQEEVYEQVKDGRYSWKPTNYSHFWGKTLEHGIKFRLGTLFPEQSVINMNEIVIKPRELPEEFDARRKWPHLIHGVKDQGDCGSSWAVSTTTIAADRLAIISGGRINKSVSAQQLVSCNQHRQKGCEGGYLDRAWWYIRKLGVVSDDCYPYASGFTGEPETCHIPKSAYRSGERLTCPSDPEGDSTVYKMTPPYRVSSREQDIQTEIVTNGPVQATFLVHEDFFMYSSGVYEHTDLARGKGEQFVGQGYHSVRILGWGVDDSTGRPIPYWLCANSWGPDWGEEGLFRILRGHNHCEIESFVIGAWGKGMKRRRRFKLRKMRRRMRRF